MSTKKKKRLNSPRQDFSVFSCHTLLQNTPRHRSHTALGWSNESLLLFSTAYYSRTSWNNCLVHKWNNPTLDLHSTWMSMWLRIFNCSTQEPSPHASSSKHHTDEQGTELLPTADRDSLAFLPTQCMAFGQFPSPHPHSSSPWSEWTNQFDWRPCWQANIPDRL